MLDLRRGRLRLEAVFIRDTTLPMEGKPRKAPRMRRLQHSTGCTMYGVRSSCTDSRP